MTTAAPLPPSFVRRAAAIARGPHSCPTCHAPMWAEPPVPWSGMRDYVVRCEGCQRPVAVRVNRGALERGEPGRDSAVHAMVDPVSDRLHRPGRGGFVWRVGAALLAPALLALCALAAGGAAPLAFLLAMVGILPASMFGPAAVALISHRVAAVLRRPLHRGGRAATTVEPARWDQWLREERRRERERADQPGAVLQELERLLDERELRRVRALADRGEVPAEHLEDLLRFRRSWQSVA